MNTSFSPGPWTAPPDKSFYVMGKLGGLIASCNSQANAQLIAASPLLLQAVLLARDELQLISDENGGSHGKPLDFILAAINQATGQNP